MPKTLESVCFDLDGTLSYYPLSTAQVLQQALARSGLPEDSLGDLVRAANRYDAYWLSLEQPANSTELLRLDILTRLLGEFGIDDESVVRRMAGAYSDVRRESGVMLYPGVDELLRDVGERYRVGLLTNGPSDMQWDKIRSLGIESRFDAIVVSGDIRIYKPDVRVFELLLSRLDTRAGHALFVGDSYTSDIVGASQAGMYTAWIQHDSSESEPDVDPTFVFTDVSQLSEVLP